MKDEVFKFLSEVMDVPVGKLNEKSSPGTVEDWDSVKHIDLVFTLEEAFNMTFSDEKVVEILSVGNHN